MTAVFWFFLSAIVVDLAGYWLHRWAHRPSSGPMHRAHMTHHVRNYPPRAVLSDKYRSSRADGLAIWFAPFGVIYALAWFLVGLPHPWIAMAGGATTAILSSVVHDLTHVSGSVVWRRPSLGGMAARHHAHHFKMGRNFGILTDVWDLIFGTRQEGSASRRHHRPQLPPRRPL